jgi:hypothetical protein
MPKKGHFQGSKKRGNHTTITPLSEKLINAARRMPYVTGINPGRIEQAHSKQPRVNFERTQTGLKAVVLSTATKQTVIFHTTCPERVEKELKAEIV